VYIRWGMGPTNASVNYGGWSLDDVEIGELFDLGQGIPVNEGDIYLAWEPTTNYYENGATLRNPDDRSYVRYGTTWYPISTYGVGIDLLARARMTTAAEDGAPTVTSVLRTGISPTRADVVNYRVAFSEDVSGVDPSDFALESSGLTGTSITAVNGVGFLYTVSVAAGAGDGTVGLRILDDDSILDLGSNPLGGAGRQEYATGPPYALDHTPPTATITLLDPNPTRANHVRFNVRFSEPVAPTFSLADLTVTGTLASGSNTSITGADPNYEISIVPPMSNGTLGLLVGANINDRAGNPCAGGAAPDLYVLDALPPVCSAPADEGEYTSSPFVTFTWPEAVDGGAPGVGVAGYWVQLGRRPGSNDLMNESVGTKRSVTFASISSQTVYARVRATDLLGNVGTFSPDSDGITVDYLPPTTTTVQDAGDLTSGTSTFRWAPASDAVSGISGYQLNIGTAPEQGEPSMRLITVGNVLAASVAALSHGSTVYARVRALDGADNPGEWSASTDGILVDAQWPRLQRAESRNWQHVDIFFNEPMRQAEDPGSFWATDGLAVLDVTRVTDSHFRLRTSDQAPGREYRLVVMPGPTDVVGNPVDPASNVRPFVAGKVTGAAHWPLYE